jgi:hypothetical protein
MLEARLFKILWVDSNAWIAGQNRLFGLLRPNSQFLRVLKLMPGFAAKFSWVKFIFMRYLASNSAGDCALFCQGGEFTLTALITKWQNGFRNDLFRQFHFV